MLQNAGVRYFLLHPEKLGLSKFQQLLEALNEVGRGRLVYLAYRAKPGTLPACEVERFSRKTSSKELKYLALAVTRSKCAFAAAYYYDYKKKAYRKHPSGVALGSDRRRKKVSLDAEAKQRLDAFLNAKDILPDPADRRARALCVLKWIRELPTTPYFELLASRESEIARELIEVAQAAFLRKEIDLEKVAYIMLGSGRRVEAINFARSWAEEGFKKSREGVHVFRMLFDRYGESVDAQLLRTVATRIADPVKKQILLWQSRRLAGRK